MNDTGNQYGGPLLCVSVTETAEQYAWEVTMSAATRDGQRKLGYKASGFLTDLDSLPPEFGIQVHDENRKVWTTMNPGDRNDIRLRIGSLVHSAIRAMKESGYS